ncbi:MAG: DUF4190 domain-containing protein [Clostridiales bacterium]|nr:DUF4190 domain-containing protein [Clostridiales bacterium]
MAKTEYKFECDENIAKETIMQFLKANNYKEQVTKDGRKYYQYSDAMVIGFLEYEIQNGMTTLYAYLRSEKKPMPLDDSFVGALPKSHYKGIIEPLLKSLSNLKSESVEVQEPVIEEKTEINEEVTVNQEKEEIKNDAYNQFADESQKTKEKFAVAAFVISLIGLVLSCFGLIYGLIIIFLEYYFAIQGLKTKKKGLAITAIVLASLSLLINILAIIIGLWIG